MRIVYLLLGTLGLATLGALVPAAPASADPLCVPVIPTSVCVERPHGYFFCIEIDGNEVCIEPI